MAKKKTEELKLSPQELRLLELNQAKIRAAKAEFELSRLQREIFIAQVDPQGKIKELSTKMQTSTTELGQLQNSHNKLVESVESRLNIKMQDFILNDETGDLIKAPDEQSSP